MSLLSAAPFRILLLMTFFILLISGFAWYTATLQYERDTAHLQFVDPQNPLWGHAKEQAKSTIDTLYALYPQHTQNSFVKFSHAGPSGFQEDIWARVVALGPGFVQVTIEPRYLAEKSANPQRELPVGQVIDWMVQLPDGNVRGGYTTQALLKMQLEQTRPDKDSLQASLQLFIDTIATNTSN